MADQNRIKQLNDEMDALLAYKAKQLVTRPEWGAINFRQAEQDITRAFTTLDLLKVLPLDYLTDNVAEKIRGTCSHLRPLFDQIDKYNIEQSNATEVRNNIVSAIHQKTDPFMEAATPWIPFLAYQKGDITANIERLSDSVVKANELIEKSKADIAAKAREIDEIIVKAREASASAGAAVFTKDFMHESDVLERRSEPWLKATAWFAGATFVIAFGTWF